MNDKAYDIEHLPIKNYSSKGRKTWKIPGEKAAVRYIDTDDFIDMSRIKIIDRDPTVNANMDDEQRIAPDIAYKKALQKDCKAARTIKFAVVGPEYFDTEEIGEVQGWIRYEEDGFVRIQAIKKYYPDILKDKKRVLEVSYARFPQTMPGQGLISSALRTTALRLLQMKETTEDTINPNTDPAKPIDLLITAYTDPVNFDSKKVLERAGFTKIGPLNYKPHTKQQDDLWVLDWNKLHALVQNKTDVTVFPTTLGIIQT